MEHITLYSIEDKKILLEIAKQSILFGIENRSPLTVNSQAYPLELRKILGSFVTLHLNARLRGCIGTLEPKLPLIEDVAKNAFLAAMRDPRFPPLSQPEFANIHFEISILSTATPMHFDSEQDLINQLRPKIDGLILSENGHRGTFLPSVWDQLPTPKEFLQRLKLKAGLQPNYWSNTIQVMRYTSEIIR